MTVKDKLQQKHNTLAPSYKKINLFLLENYDRIEKLSIQEIGRSCGSSLSTIFRLCQKMGYRGFRELRDDVLKEIHLLEIKKSENLEEAIFRFELSMVKELIKLLSTDSYKKAVAKCASAAKLLWIAIGDSANVLPFLDFRCNVLEIDSGIIMDPVRYIMGINDLKDNAVILIISQSGNTELLRDAIKTASGSPCTFIGITANRESILAKSVDIVLVIPSWNVNTKKHYFSLRGPEMVFLDLFILSIGLKKGSISKEEFKIIFNSSKK